MHLRSASDWTLTWLLLRCSCSVAAAPLLAPPPQLSRTSAAEQRADMSQPAPTLEQALQASATTGQQRPEGKTEDDAESIRGAGVSVPAQLRWFQQSLEMRLVAASDAAKCSFVPSNETARHQHIAQSRHDLITQQHGCRGAEEIRIIN